MTRDQYLCEASFYALCGSDLPHAVLSEEKVRDIRARFRPYSRTDGARAIARDYGVHFNTIWKVTSRDTWAHA